MILKKVKLEDDKGVDDYNKANSIYKMPSQFGSSILSHSKRLMIDVIRQTGGFFINNIYYFNTISLYIHKRYWSDLVDNGFAGKSLSFGGNDYGNSGKFYAWFLAPKIQYSLVTDDFGVISATRTFKG